MINDESKRKLRELNMCELIDALEMQQQNPATLNLKFDDRMQRAIDYLYQEKYNNRIQRMIKSARLRFPQADIHDIYYDGRGLDTQLLDDLFFFLYIFIILCNKIIYSNLINTFVYVFSLYILINLCLHIYIYSIIYCR